MPKRNPILSIVVVASVILMATVVAVFAQQSTAQQNCLNKLNKDGSGVAKQQGKLNSGCLKSAGTTSPGAGQSCLTADAKGKVQHAKLKTSSDDAAACGTVPTFGYTGGTTVNTAAVQGELSLAADIFGGDLDAAVISCTSNKAGCKCQQKVLGDVEKLGDAKLKEFVNCKKAALKAGANSATALSDCVSNAGTPGSIAADTKGKIAKAAGKINADVVKSCDTPGVTATAFPGDCTGLTGSSLPTLGACLDARTECRVCQIINQMDGLSVDCDLFDDGIANTSCANTGPTPTPTPTLTPTPTVTPTCAPGPVFQGSLTATVGRFNYNLTLGLPGANSACNTNFAGSHACTYFELQCAQTAGSLVGAMDTGANLVTSFWAIEPAKPPLTQCNDDVSSMQNWEYATAHTASRGQRVALNNPLGTLGPLQTGLQCNFSGSSWVGCCQ